MATNETTSVKKIPSFMRGTANSNSKTDRPSTTSSDRKRVTSQSQRVSYQPRTPVPKSPAHKIDRSISSDVTSKPLPIPSSTKRSTVKTGDSVKPVETKWERLMKKIPKDCAVYPSPKREKPATREEFEILQNKGYYKIDDSVQDDGWHIITVMLYYNMEELNKKWEVECSDGLFWVTFKDRDIEPGSKYGKWLVRAKIRNSDKWLHAYLIHNPPLVARDMSVTVTDEVVWAIGDYDYWDELPEWQ